jgi:hypothetical protein
MVFLDFDHLCCRILLLTIKSNKKRGLEKKEQQNTYYIFFNFGIIIIKTLLINFKMREINPKG